jgi:small redox-active disulfide protein 2
MIIQILGPGCSRCKTLHETVRRALVETGVEAFVEKVEDIQQIMAYDLLMTPGLVIDGMVKTAGRLPDVAEVKALILAARDGSSAPA